MGKQGAIFRLPPALRAVSALIALSGCVGPVGFRLVEYTKLDPAFGGIPVAMRLGKDAMWLAGGFAVNIGLFLLDLLLYVVVVDPDGVTYHRLWRFQWDDVVGARERVLLGMKFLHVRRISGIPLWIPLYYVGGRPMREVLRDQAPDGNPIRTCLDAGT